MTETRTKDVPQAIEEGLSISSVDLPAGGSIDVIVKVPLRVKLAAVDLVPTNNLPEFLNCKAYVSTKGETVVRLYNCHNAVDLMVTDFEFMLAYRDTDIEIKKDKPVAVKK